MPILCGTEEISLSRAKERTAASPRQVVYTKGRPWAQLAKALQPHLSRKLLSPNSAKPLPPPEKGVRCEERNCHNLTLPIGQQGLTPSYSLEAMFVL